MQRRVSCLLIALAAGALNAQVPDSAGIPPVPTSIPRLRQPPDPIDSGFATWRRIPLPRHDDVPAAWTLRGGDWDFLIATPRAMDAMDTSRIVETTLETCARPLNVSEQDMQHVAAARPWAAFDSVMEDRPALVISIMPVLHNSTECGSRNLGRPAMIRRGVRFVTNYVYDAARDPRSAVLLSRLRVVRPIMLAHVPTIVMSRNLMSSNPTDQIRLYIPYDAIAPGAAGDMPETELQIWSKVGGPPAHIPLPRDIMRAVWWDYLRWRGTRLANRVRPTATAAGNAHLARPGVPIPTDTALRTALLLEREHRDADAAAITLERLADKKLAINDRRIALLSLAATFRDDGDAPAAALLANELAVIDPCALTGNETLRAAPIAEDDRDSAHGEDAMPDRTRSELRCTAFPPGATLLRGLLIPGYGQYRTWSRAAGAGIAVLTVAGAVTSLHYLNTANSSYAKYGATQTGFAAYYRTAAKRDRLDARTMATASAGLWLASAVGAEVHERLHAAHVAAERNFWFRPVATETGTPGGAGAALAAGLTFAFR